MSKARRRAKAKRAEPVVSSDPGASLSAAALAIVLAGVPLFVDTGADASFDAPKRLLAFSGLALAAAAAFAWPGRGRVRALWQGLPTQTRAAAWALLGALGWGLVSALLSPRRAAALDSWRAAVLLACALALGASRVVARRGRMLAGVFLAGGAVDAAVSIAQSRGWYRPFEMSAIGMRDETGAFVGNVGYLATALALCAAGSLALLLSAQRRAVRLVAGACLALFLAGLAVNQNLTALSGALAGFIVVLVARFRKRALLPIAAGVGGLALLVAAYAPLRARVVQVASAASAGDWDRLTTYRGGPWAAAVEMARERPLLGFGPGSFGAEFVPHRLTAEIRWQRRFVNPLVTSSYGEAHSDYLQPFAEAGAPAGLAALGAAALLLAGAVRLVRSASGDSRGEPLFLLALLSAGAVAALTWFPLQRPITAVALLLAAGRAWRLSGGPPDAEAVPQEPVGKPVALARAAAVVAALGLLLWPELPRYAAERKLRAGLGAFRFVLTRSSELSDPPAALERVTQIALEASSALPGDPRPLALAAGSRLAGGQAERALELYRAALATGERAELDLNMGRALDALARNAEAAAWFLRGGWVSPPLLASLLPDLAGPAANEVVRLEGELRAGRLASPPPLPP